MNVRSTYSGIEAATQFDGLSVGRGDEKPSSLHSVCDRSVISHRRRTELNEILKKPETNGRIKALLSSVQLTKRQTEDLLSRIREGYYLRPEILHTMAAVICSVLDAEP